MSKENKRLGRGLEALLRNVAAAQTNTAQLDDALEVDAQGNAFPSIVPFSTNPSDSLETSVKETRTKRSDLALLEEEKDRALAQYSNGGTAVEINVDLIDPNPYQPRLDFDEVEMEELKASLSEHGLIQPIVLRQNGDRYEIIAGERRFRAAKESGWKKIPAILFVVEDREMAELALTENMQRRDLNPIEKAAAFKSYIDAYGTTHEELAKRLSLDRSTVSNLMRLLELHEEVQNMTRQGKITMGHARALLPLDEWNQIEMARRIVDEQLSVRQTEAIVKEFIEGNTAPSSHNSKTSQQQSPRVQELEQQFRSWLGMKVKLTSNDKGKGKLVVQFSSNDEFERIYQLLKPRDF
ncbi:MAG: ParB/RepB/Spo0J family partition protein [Thermoguttaceae bacterium]|nr:ParB/RepB/Spo0J family partition protein [Thermoguttaceae bacterium]